MLLLVFVAIAGGFLTAAIMVPYGPLVALFGDPLGGSLSAAVAALVLMCVRGPAYQSEEDIDAQTDAMVADLRGIVAQARRQEPAPPETEQATRRA
ncbi:hypothetical protein DK412_25890 [Methylobacterium sp. 17Sr1-1]|nr:hypothetical protein DK412_25890 [Methylobacterium sp. 17Sr1-1]